MSFIPFATRCSETILASASRRAYVGLQRKPLSLVDVRMMSTGVPERKVRSTRNENASFRPLILNM
jgi:hypothetical protein